MAIASRQDRQYRFGETSFHSARAIVVVVAGGQDDAYHVAGDGVVVPVVSHRAEQLLEHILAYDDVASARIAAE